MIHESMYRAIAERKLKVAKKLRKKNIKVEG